MSNQIKLDIDVEQRFRDEVEPLAAGLRIQCIRLTGNEWNADDLVQETLMKAYRALLNDASRPVTRAFLYTIAKRTWIDMFRRSRLPVSSVLPDSTMIGIETNRSLPEGLELREALETVLHRLPARQATVLLLMDVYAFTAKETAKRIDASEGAVTMALSRARANVRQLLADGAHETVLPRSVIASAGSAANQGFIQSLVRAFERHDPDRMIRAYLQLGSSGLAISRIGKVGEVLQFVIRDPNGIEIMIYTKR